MISPFPILQALPSVYYGIGPTSSALLNRKVLQGYQSFLPYCALHWETGGISVLSAPRITFLDYSFLKKGFPAKLNVRLYACTILLDFKTYLIENVGKNTTYSDQRCSYLKYVIVICFYLVYKGTWPIGCVFWVNDPGLMMTLQYLYGYNT